MIVSFKVKNYVAVFGNSLFITLKLGTEDEITKEMNYDPINKVWFLTETFKKSEDNQDNAHYRYSVYPSGYKESDIKVLNKTDRMCDKHSIDALIHTIPHFDEKNDSESKIEIIDDWAPKSSEPWNTSAFRVFFERRNLTQGRFSIPRATPDEGCMNVYMRVFVPVLNRADRVYVVGSSKELGEWEPSRAVLLKQMANRSHETKIFINKPEVETKVEFKYFIKNAYGNIVWESGDNRSFVIENTEEDPIAHIEHSFFRFSYVDPKHINYIKPRFTGVNVPVFSLRSTKSFGCGEFADLKLLADFCERAGINIIQILPIFDTMSKNTWVDSYPYGAITVFALHPMFVRLSEIDGISKELLEEIETSRVTYETEEKVNDYLSDIRMDYEKTVELKIAFLHKIFNELTNSEEKTARLLKEIKKWVSENPEVAYWVRGYSLFKALGERYGTVQFNASSKNSTQIPWKGTQKFGDKIYDHAEFMKLNDAEKQKIIKEIYETHDLHIVFWTWVQYVLDCQVRDAANYAREHNICLKGDVPIGVNRISVDTWERTSLFNMDTMTGAPPDAFSAVGQNWGFPTYNWDPAMKNDNNYEWWTMRFKVMARYFDAFRIDHVLGWFRIWEIPAYCMKGNGRLGHFSPCKAIHKEWLEESGIWDFDRLCNAYMPEKHVQEYCQFNPDYYRFLTEGVGNIKPILVQRKSNIEEKETFYEFNPEIVDPDNVETCIYDYLQQFVEKDEDLFDNESISKSIADKVFYICQLLNCNRCLTFDREHPESLVHPVFANLKDETQTLAFRDLDGGSRYRIRQLTHDYFYEWHGEEWTKTAAERMPIISNAADMLVIGEDLGLLHPCVPKMMEKRDMLGLRVQRMPADPHRSFTNCNEYNWMTVATPATHDCPGIRSWWHNGGKAIKIFWNEELHRCGEPSKEISTQDCLNIFRMHTYSGSMIAMFLLQDIFSITKNTSYDGKLELEDINHPDVPEFYWRYRMHITLEDLIAKYEISTILKDELINAKRFVGNNL